MINRKTGVSTNRDYTVGCFAVAPQRHATRRGLLRARAVSR
jgi:hypothetical protein